MIRTIVVGGGMVGLTLARLLRARGHDPVVLERGPAGAVAPRAFMLGHQGFDAFEELGILGRLRAAGRDVGTGPDGRPIGIAVDVGEVMRALAEGVAVADGQVVVDLVRDGARVRGVVTEGPGGRAAVAADLVVACDGRGSPVRAMAGLEARVHPLNDAYLGYVDDRPTETLFGFRYMTDGGMITMLGWPQGGSASRRIDRVGRAAATAPDLARFTAGFVQLLPEAEEVVRRIRSWDQVRYVEPALLRCPRWWTPGVVVIGDAARVFGPDTGAGAGVGIQDAHALAEAIARETDPDAACARYATWREPAVRPLEALDPGWSRTGEITAPPDRPAAEVWPPA